MNTPSQVVVRNQLRRRRAIRAKLKGHRVKLRWIGGHLPPAHWMARGPEAPYAWIDEAWAAVWG